MAVYSRYYEKNQAVQAIREKQNELIKKAQEEKQKATDHLSRLEIQAKLRSDLDKLIAGTEEEAPLAEEVAPVESEEKEEKKSKKSKK